MASEAVTQEPVEPLGLREAAREAVYVYDGLDGSSSSMEALRAALSRPAATPLDAAWAAAEALLPKGWRLSVQRAEDYYDLWSATAVSPAFFDGETDDEHEVGEGATPAEALFALVSTLAAARTAGSPAVLDEPTLQALLRELLQGSGEMYSFASEFIWRRTAEYAALSAGSPAALPDTEVTE